MSNFFVFDTNSLISAALTPHSTNRKAMDKAIILGDLAISKNTIAELTEVLFRKKFDKYFQNEEERWSIINKLEINAKQFSPTISITDCRDPKANMFLELAIATNASCIITGDDDLLILNPFREIPILNASDFFNNF